MALRLSLVIDGTAEGAKKAAADAAAAVSQVGDAAAKASQAAASASASSTAQAGQRASEAGKAVALTSQQLQNMQFQMQDIAVSVASGQSFGRVLLQQGSQIVQAFGTGTGVAAALKATGAGIVSFITSPLNIALLAIAGVGMAVEALWTAVASTGRADDALERHDQIIKDIKRDWDSATASQGAYAEWARLGIRFQSGGDQFRLNLGMQTEQQALYAQLTPAALFGNGFQQTNPQAIASIYQRQYGLLGDAVRKFAQEAAQGKGDVLAFNAEVERIALEHPDDAGLRRLAESLLNSTDKATALANALREVTGQVAKLDTAGQALTQYGKFAAKEMEDSFDLQRQQAAALLGVGARSPGEKAAAARASVLAQPINPNESEYVQQLRAENAATLAAAQAEQALSDAARARMRSVMDAVGASQIDIATLGKSVGETATLQANWQAYTQLRAEAEQNHVAFDDAQYQRLVKQNEAAGRLKQTYAEMSVLGDLRFDASQIGRSPIEQQVASTLRGIYQDDYQSYMGSAIATQIRFNAKLSEARDLTQGFFADLRSGVSSGKSFFDALADAAGRLEDKLLDMASNQAINSLFGLFTGGGANVGGVSFPTFSSFSAKGNVFSAGQLVPFAKGTVVGAPTIFPMADGKTGMMGEAGPEGILPLARGANGALGVRSTGGEIRVRLELVSADGAPVAARDGGSRREGGVDIQRIIVAAAADDIMNDGPLASALTGTFGLSRRTRNR
jgi:hypothetical protein